MRITYIKLVNFAGIYAGTGLHEFELNLENTDKVITMLLGANGSGKTTLLSNLNPFRGTNDERDKPILKGEKGLKEIHIKDRDDLFIITHHYGTNSSGNKSFITKNGKELNDNGGIRTFDNIIEKELGVTTDYFKIGRIGSNVTSFIGLSSTDRKKFIGNFIPNIDSYLSKFEVAKKHYQAVSRDIKSLEGSLSKLNDMDSLEAIKNSLVSMIEDDKNTLEQYNQDVTKYNTLIATLLENSSEDELRNKLSSMKIELDNLLNEIGTAKNNFEIFTNKYPNLANYTYEMLDETINNQNLLIEQLNSQYNNNENMKDNFTKRLISINDKINRSKLSNFDIDVYNNLLDENIKLENEIREYSDVINNDIDLLTNDMNEMINVRNKRESLVDSFINVKSRYTNDIIEYEFDINEYNDIINKRDNLVSRIDLLTKDVNSIEARKGLLESLKLRPAECNIESCPFISSAIDFKREYDSMNSIHDEILILNKELDSVNSKIEYLDEVRSFREELSKLSSIMNIDISTSYDIMKFEVHDIQEYILSNINEQIRQLEFRNNLNVTREKKSNIEMNLKSMSEIKLLNEQISSELEFCNVEKKELEESIMSINKQQTDINNSIIKNKKKLEIAITFRDSKNIIDNKISEMEDLNNNTSDINNKLLKLKEYKDNINFINNNISVVKNRIIPNENRLLEVNRDLILVKEYSAKLEKLTKDFEKYKLLRDSLDPKMGIPLVFIDNYLTDISVKTNELLNNAYNGRFQIEFEITDKEFLIKVLKGDGTELKDITEASQGELSMTTVSLSMALIESSMSKYDILYLDEVDATLSTENRRVFIDILENQISKLGLEQVFVISHNNEFFSHSINMILMKNADIDITDNDLMENKTIIYKY